MPKFTSKLLPVLGLALACSVAGCSDEPEANTSSTGPASNQAESSRPAAPLVTDLQVSRLKVGSGKAAASRNDVLLVNYTGWLYDQTAKGKRGKKFDSSLDRAPLKFVLGKKQVIAGWESGVVGMLVGEKRQLVIPSHLAYGVKGAGNDIPPNAPLIFEIELLSIN